MMNTLYIPYVATSIMTANDSRNDPVPALDDTKDIEIIPNEAIRLGNLWVNGKVAGYNDSLPINLTLLDAIYEPHQLTL